MNRPTTTDSTPASTSWRRAGSPFATASTGALLVAVAATPVVAGLRTADPQARSAAPASPAAVATSPRPPAPLRPRTRETRAARTSRGRRTGTASRALTATGPTYTGRASWYGPGFHGRRTANGERYDMYGLTAAHRTLPFGTRLRVCRAGRCTIVRVNDRGPYAGRRILDLSRGAAAQIGLLDNGVSRVTATVVARRR